MVYLFIAIYGTILLSELLGDKTVYAISSLAMRFRPFHVFCGFSAAFMIKMLMAVLLGHVIGALPTALVAIVSTTTFLLTALAIWFKKTGDGPREREYENYSSRATLITFAAIVFSEWGDAGQIMAATLTARYHLPLVVWLGGTLALITKGLLALVLGRGLRKHIPLHLLRPVSAILCVIMAVLSAIGGLAFVV